MNVFEFDNYKKFVIKRVSSMPKKGHGQFRRMANFLSINSVNVTQIFKGDRELSVEQACLLGEYFGLSELETEYFVNLVEHARAGHFKLKSLIEKRLQTLKEKSMNLKDRITSEEVLSEKDKALFYASWMNSGVRLLTSVPGYQNADMIAKYFDLPLAKVNRVLEFLLQTNLCVENEKGEIRMGPKSTHLEAASPLIVRHHTNWRLKAIERMEQLTANELCLSMPCSLSESSTKAIRKELVDVIERITQIIDTSSEERLQCLNIDWFQI
jgi:uncharacterized protein (TIGR02147 family)